MGYAKVRGRFASFNGSFFYDETDMSKTSVSLLIEVESIDTDSDFRDNDLKSDNWFGVEKNPFIEFTSTKVEHQGDMLFATGNLKIKNVTKEVVLQLDKPSGILKDARGDNQVIFSGSTIIDRKNFGVQGDNWSRFKEGITAVSDEVHIEFTALGKQILKENYSNRVRNIDKPQGLIYSIYKDQGLIKAMAKFDELASDPANNIRTGVLNTVGYMMLKEGATNDAEIVFKKNIDQFPNNAFVYDSYAEALVENGQWDNAKENYKIALEKNPNNMNAKEILKHIEHLQ